MNNNPQRKPAYCSGKTGRRIRVGEINYSAEQINELLDQIPKKANRDEVPKKVSSYNELKDQPSINNQKLIGNKSSEDLGLVSEKRMQDTTDKLAKEIYKGKKTAQTALDAVKTLQGIADADVSAITAANVVVQVETNKIEIESIKANTIYLSKEEYKKLVDTGTYNPETEYNVFED